MTKILMYRIKRKITKYDKEYKTLKKRPFDRDNWDRLVDCMMHRYSFKSLLVGLKRNKFNKKPK